MLCALVILLLARHHLRRALAFAGAALGLLTSTVILKEWLEVPRPPEPLIEIAGYAFPSGHAAGSIFLAIVAAYGAHTLPKPLRYGVFVVAALFAFSIGMSRLYFGVHTPFQVLVGYLLGFVWAVVFIEIARRVESAS